MDTSLDITLLVFWILAESEWEVEHPCYMGLLGVRRQNAGPSARCDLAPDVVTHHPRASFRIVRDPWMVIRLTMSIVRIAMIERLCEIMSTPNPTIEL